MARVPPSEMTRNALKDMFVNDGVKLTWSCPVLVDGLALGSQAVIHRLRAGRFYRNRARRPVGNRALAIH